MLELLESKLTHVPPCAIERCQTATVRWVCSLGDQERYRAREEAGDATDEKTAENEHGRVRRSGLQASTKEQPEVGTIHGLLAAKLVGAVRS